MPGRTQWRAGLSQRLGLECLLENILNKGHSMRVLGSKPKHFHAEQRLLAREEPRARVRYVVLCLGFPNLFAVAGLYVATARHSYEGADIEARRRPQAAQCSKFGWRELGSDTRMVPEICRRFGRKSRIDRNDTCICGFTRTDYDLQNDYGMLV